MRQVFCHLDTGVNRSHPLLGIALDEEHMLTVMPGWLAADQDGHGTEMAGLALYGDLASLLEGDGPVELRHRLESVKVYRTDKPHDPELYGEITAQAASRIEIAAPRAKPTHFLPDGDDRWPRRRVSVVLVGPYRCDLRRSRRQILRRMAMTTGDRLLSWVD